MPSIDKNATFVTQINKIKVEPKNQEALVQRMIQQIEEVAVKQPGFISSTLHKSRDQHYVINYVQWESTELLDAFHNLPEFQAQAQTYKHYILESAPVVYDIVYSQEA